MTAPWWRSAVFYQIYPRSFATSAGRRRATSPASRPTSTTCAWLGVDAVWLSPFYPSPMADFGYDVTDYCDVDPIFGDLADVRPPAGRLPRAGAAAARRLRPQPHVRPAPVVRRVRDRAATTPKRDWYVWRDGDPDDPAQQLAGGVQRRPGVDVGRGHRPVVPPPVPRRRSPTSTGPTPRCRRHARRHALLARPRASTGSASTWSTASARTRRCPTTRPRWQGSPTASSTTGPRPTS